MTSSRETTQSFRIQRPDAPAGAFDVPTGPGLPGRPNALPGQPGRSTTSEAESFLRENVDGEQADVETEEMIVNMGPQHPSTHGVLRVVLRTDGEMILEATPVIGYLHRCAEKIGESLAYFQYIPYTDRMDYLAGMNENWAYCRAVETLAGIQLPRRAELIRIMICELNRIASHLVSFGCYGLDLGAFTPFLYAFREREYVLDLFEMVCGARLTYSYFTVGGSTYDLPDGFLEKVIEFCDYFEPKLEEYRTLLTRNQIFIKRTADVGVISPELAIQYALTGPVLRASGIALDLRRPAAFAGTRPGATAPLNKSGGGYSLYDELDFNVVVGNAESGTIGDCWNRYDVRMREMTECVKIVRQCVAKMPAPDPAGPANSPGRYRLKLPRNFKPDPGEVYVETENPRGVFGFFLESQGGPIAYRCKARAATFCNLSILHAIAKNCLLADMPAIIGSIDIVMGQVDR